MNRYSAPNGRFGFGMYFSATSGKAHDYCQKGPPSDCGLYHMFVVKVVAGRASKVQRSPWSQGGVPDGFDSVVGDPASVDELNYDEILVDCEHAVYPLFLVTYK